MQPEADGATFPAAQQGGGGDPDDGGPVEKALGGIGGPDGGEDEGIADAKLDEIAETGGRLHTCRLEQRAQAIDRGAGCGAAGFVHRDHGRGRARYVWVLVLQDAL